MKGRVTERVCPSCGAIQRVEPDRRTRHQRPTNAVVCYRCGHTADRSRWREPMLLRSQGRGEGSHEK